MLFRQMLIAGDLLRPSRGVGVADSDSLGAWQGYGARKRLPVKAATALRQSTALLQKMTW